MERTDEKLVGDYINGDESALELLIGRYLDSIYNFVYRLVGNPGDSEDIVQEAFIKFWRNIKKYRPSEKFKTWIFTIARNTAIDFLRKKKNLTFSDFKDGEDETLIDNVADSALLPDELVFRVEEADSLEDALNKLPVRYQEILILHYDNELTFEEIGKILGSPLNTVKSRHRRALAAIRKILNAPKGGSHPYK